MPSETAKSGPGQEKEKEKEHEFEVASNSPPSELITLEADQRTLVSSSISPRIPSSTLSDRPTKLRTGTIRSLASMDNRTFEQAFRQHLTNQNKKKQKEPTKTQVKVTEKAPSIVIGSNPNDPDTFLGPWAKAVSVLEVPCGPTPEQTAKYLDEAAQRATIKVHCLDESDLITDTDRGSGYKLLPGEERSICHYLDDEPDEQFNLAFNYMRIDPSLEEEATAIYSTNLDRCTANKSLLTNFVPKKVVHRWAGHTKGVNVISFLPKYGTLLLSGAQDGRVKLWSQHGGILGLGHLKDSGNKRVKQEKNVSNSGQVLRTFIGHSKPIKDVKYVGVSGGQFASMAYDRYIKVWDTETGRCIKSIQSTPLMYGIEAGDNGNILLACTEDKSVLQWDLRAQSTSSPSFIYDQHQGPVTCFAFINPRHFLTASEDKSIRLFELGSEQVVQAVQDPGLGHVSHIISHPHEPLIAMQTFYDQITVLSLEEGRDGSNDQKLIRTRRAFKGTESLGHPCKMSISPDGRFIASGDGRGVIHVWDWHSGSLVRQLKEEHGGKVVPSVAWHPLDPSGLASAGWDGNINYWQ